MVVNCGPVYIILEVMEKIPTVFQAGQVIFKHQGGRISADILEEIKKFLIFHGVSRRKRVGRSGLRITGQKTGHAAVKDNPTY